MKSINLIVLFTILIAVTQSALVPKNLQGKPSEFSNFKLPNPKDVAQTSDSSLLTVSLVDSKTTSNVEWVGTVPVDSTQEFTITLFSQFYTQLTLEAFPPTSKIAKAHDRNQWFGRSHNVLNVTTSNFGIDGATVPSVTYTWYNPTVGDWTIKLVGPAAEIKKVSATPTAMLLVQNPSNLQIYSYLSSYNNLFIGEKVPVIAMIQNHADYLPKEKRPLNWQPTIIKLAGASAQINVFAPDGQESTIEMYDDGLHDDVEANDGVFGAYLQVNETGNYQAQVIFKGADQGTNIFRSNQHIIPISDDYLSFTGNVFSQQSQDDTELIVYFEVEGEDLSAAPAVRLYSEVWGTDSKGKSVPIAWVSGITTVQQVNNLQVLQATLDSRWIAKADATEPFTVKNVIFSDMNTYVPLDNQTSTSNVKMMATYRDVRTLQYDPPLHVITKQMRDGKMPAHLASRFGKATGNGKLILVHGYCSDDNPWPVEDFENAVQYEDFNQNRPTDEFARMVGEFGEQFTDGFSIIGHSQGGNEALHLLTFYHSGLDLSQAFPGRVVQSVGTPYQGTALAGTLASIGKIVGIGCSANNDLTVDGAALWLNTIPADKRKLVYYATSQYKTGSLVNYCNLGANAVLKWPNDGVVDLDHASLYGGTYVDNFKGYCHTTDMKSPPQTSNTEFNKKMSAESVW
ncbi:hypothetical protein CYY_001810 [Polysphondylium violaceum]|uniref:Conditioned medium factor n=1 Tax=Polysphondylium violaceum TaxID=133409 RepID=A0A8J4V7J5_9MYCE|nr:hypothetical protein CYY_001810 [Polysphondylium violaceum]